MEPTPPTEPTPKPISPWLKPAVLLIALVAANILGAEFFWRFDLTAEGRFSLSPVTLQTLDSLQAPVTFRVYTEGDYPPTLKRFQGAVKTLLQEMKAYGGSTFQLQFINPQEDTAARRRFARMGLQPLPVRITQNEMQRSETYFYPFASIIYDNKEEVIDLIKGTTAEREVNLLKGEQELEYKLTTSLRRLALKRRPTVGLLQGQKEYNRTQIPYFLQEASQFYGILPITLQPGIQLVPAGTPPTGGVLPLDVLLVAQPDAPFSEPEKYILDQYLLRGGKILWLLDNQRIDDISLEQQGSTLTQPRSLNLDDLFFNYGLKVNYDLTQDALCGFIDAVRTENGRDRLSQERWLYFPLIRKLEPHPVTKNIDAVLLRYASTIDTLKRAGITHTPILRSSPYSRTLSGSILINFTQTLSNPPTPEMFRSPTGKPLGLRVLGASVEGRFRSVFAGRSIPDATSSTLPFLETGNGQGKMIIYADGALILGNHSRAGNPSLPVDNRLLLLNSIDWLIGDAALTDIRAREVQVRTLDAQRVLGHETSIRLINIALPLLLVVVFGAVRYYMRKRRHEG